jgi:hypothetical protein
MFATPIRNLIRSSALLAVAIAFAASAKPVAAEFHTVDISSQFNTDLRSIFGGSQYPVAPFDVSIGGVPFDLEPLANTADSLGIVFSPLGPYEFVFPVNLPNAVAVYTLIDSAYGTFGANNGLVEAFGTGGAYASFDLVQGTNIRDYVQNVFNNTVGPDIQSVLYGSVRLDRQVLLLPASFQGQTLTEIRFSGVAGNPTGQPFVAAITVQVPEPSSLILAALGLGVLVVGWTRRK